LFSDSSLHSQHHFTPFFSLSLSAPRSLAFFQFSLALGLLNILVPILETLLPYS